MITLEHIDPRNSDHICGLENDFNEVIAESTYNNRKNNRFVPYRVCDHPAPVTFGDVGEFLINGEWVVCEFGGDLWWNEGHRIGCNVTKGKDYERTQKQRDNLREISYKHRNDPRCVEGRLRGAKAPSSEKQKEAARRQGYANRGITRDLSPEAAEKRADGGRQGGKTVGRQRWECLVTGRVSTPGGLARYQKARGIDPSLRRRIS